ncbi:hypothetical protein K466DRAFT_5825 [Polyporus arcularius HHB13444]|uniref:Uncharacterized protein n=1 Tax=Polyporus arcularius HHB13444 TaxID=1314778 RepID=A0A5C3PWE0_9APHY|nr:hypothetical protein K466DRAFT_5825 [Polyporus arcularius HHB13444]
MIGDLRLRRPPHPAHFLAQRPSVYPCAHKQLLSPLSQLFTASSRSVRALTRNCIVSLRTPLRHPHYRSTDRPQKVKVTGTPCHGGPRQRLRLYGRWTSGSCLDKRKRKSFGRLDFLEYVSAFQSPPQGCATSLHIHQGFEREEHAEMRLRPVDMPDLVSICLACVYIPSLSVT